MHRGRNDFRHASFFHMQKEGKGRERNETDRDDRGEDQRNREESMEGSHRLSRGMAGHRRILPDRQTGILQPLSSRCRDGIPMPRMRDDEGGLFHPARGLFGSLEPPPIFLPSNDPCADLCLETLHTWPGCEETSDPRHCAPGLDACFLRMEDAAVFSGRSSHELLLWKHTLSDQTDDVLPSNQKNGMMKRICA